MFQEWLKRLVSETEGGIAGVLMGFDGIAVDSYTAPNAAGPDVNNVGMEFGFILTQVRKAAESLESGQVKEVAVRTDQLTLVLQVLSDEYFFAIVQRPDGNFGKARFMMRLVAPHLRAEL
jgi:predicted regulator of Ras-like GTPase activity (Roadblock/LC7/MglB family)